MGFAPIAHAIGHSALTQPAFSQAPPRFHPGHKPPPAPPNPTPGRNRPVPVLAAITLSRDDGRA